MAFQDTIVVCMVSGFYLAANGIALIVPCVLYSAYHGSVFCRALCLLIVVDYCVPLKMPGLWMGWCRVANDSEAKTKYFPAEVILESEFRKDRNYLVCYHPHSLFGIGYNLFTALLYEKYGIETLFTGADVVQYLPLLRRVLTWWGITPVSAPAMRKNLKRPYPQNVLTLLPGGIAEMFYGVDEEQLVLGKRKGFCKIALQTGASIVPCYAFGANQVFTRYCGPRSVLARLSSVIHTSIVVWTDRFGIPFGIVPCRTKMVVALGSPIDVTAVEHPTPEQVNELHAKYVTELKGLFNRHKSKMGSEWADKTLYLEDEPIGTIKGSKGKSE